MMSTKGVGTGRLGTFLFNFFVLGFPFNAKETAKQERSDFCFVPNARREDRLARERGCREAEEATNNNGGGGGSWLLFSPTLLLGGN